MEIENYAGVQMGRWLPRNSIFPDQSLAFDMQACTGLLLRAPRLSVTVPVVPADLPGG